MGQGTDSCGGYEAEYDPYEEGLEKGEWTTRSGGSISVEKMSPRHLRNAINVCKNLAACATFTDQEDKWNAWVEVLENELERRPQSAPKTVKATAPKQKPRGTTVQMICFCGNEYSARKADLDRGWALTCSKSCAAIRREFGRPAAKRK